MYVGEKSITPSMDTAQRSGRSISYVGMQENSMDTMHRVPSEDALAEMYTQELMKRLVAIGQGDSTISPAFGNEPEECESPAVVGRVTKSLEDDEKSEQTIQRNFSLKGSIVLEKE